MCRFVLAAFLIVNGALLIGCEGAKKATESEQEVILVRIPPLFDPNLTHGENHCMFAAWWHPSPEPPYDIFEACKGAGLPNDGVPLTVALSRTGEISLNGEPNGTIADPTQLIERLSKIFEERAVNRVLVPDTENVEKSVGLRIPTSASYEEAFKIARAVRRSSAEPIILFLDGHLPLQMPVSE